MIIYIIIFYNFVDSLGPRCQTSSEVVSAMSALGPLILEILSKEFHHSSIIEVITFLFLVSPAEFLCTGSKAVDIYLFRSY